MFSAVETKKYYNFGISYVGLNIFCKRLQIEFDMHPAKFERRNTMRSY